MPALRIRPSPSPIFLSGISKPVSYPFTRLYSTSSLFTFASLSRARREEGKMAPIERVTMFKIPKQEDREKVLEGYRHMKKTAVKDGKPYILTCEAGEAADEPRAQGWNLVNKSTFASKADMDFYDQECQAHAQFKQLVIPVKTDLMTVWYESATRDSML
ncbi:hypothetical protein BTJ68_13794 [Hortaea werneckii EXF-2000]|uniref:Stress-response A/B barrel domain-containing protein n=1 Tax=Hortaea werneckii EXF-2000 TaxID=1157616 RepID=A0A1Z5SRQ9_HORWE|nr:hypothetical protein BTJ68_13794 [Hortaea werneckii EXF-2000]